MFDRHTIAEHKWTAIGPKRVHFSYRYESAHRSARELHEEVGVLLVSVNDGRAKEAEALYERDFSVGLGDEAMTF